jgi:hypothetical protein
MNRNRIVPILASVGIGAAAYYSMRRGKTVGDVAQQAIPLAGALTGQGSQNQNTMNNQG